MTTTEKKREKKKERKKEQKEEGKTQLVRTRSNFFANFFAKSSVATYETVLEKNRKASTQQGERGRARFIIPAYILVIYLLVSGKTLLVQIRSVP